MLTVHQDKKIVSKIIKTPDGRLALVHFLLVVENGKIINAKPISVQFQENPESFLGQEEILAISGEVKNPGEITSRQNFYNKIISPYSQLLFFVSQRTRAPSF
jgi:hypothetical protein